MIPGFGKKFPLSTAIAIPFIALIIASVTLVGYLSFINGQEAVNEAAVKVRQTSYAQILQHLDSFLEAPHRVNQLNANYIQISDLDLDDPIALQNYFWQQLQIFDTTSYIYFGNTKGGIMLLARRADGSFVARQTDQFAAGKSTVYNMTAKGNRGTILEHREFYDSRGRPWYKSASKTTKPIWTNIYPFFLENALGITAALPLYGEDGDLRGVLATDVLLSHIQQYLIQLTKKASGTIFIFEPSGALVASSTTEQPYRISADAKSISRISADESNSSLIRTAYKHLTDQPGGLEAIKGSRQLEFTLNGERQFLQVSPFHDDRGIHWMIAITVPETAFMARINKNTQITIALCFMALIVTVFMSFFLARWVTTPLSNLKKAATALANGNWGYQIPDEGIEEVNTLGHSFNTMANQIQRSFSTLKNKNEELYNTQIALREANQQLAHRIEAKMTELDESEERYKCLAEATFEGVILHSGGIILDANKAIEEIFDYRISEIKGQNILDFIAPEYRERVKQQLLSPNEAPHEIAVNRKDGRHLTLEIRGKYSRFKGEQVRVAVMRDITEKKRSDERLRMMATTDALTSLYNRRHFQELAEIELKKARRFNHQFSLLLLDIDDFQGINDTYGGAMGDEVLKAMTYSCKTQLRDVDLMGRIRGKEFAVILPETDEKTAMDIAEHLQGAVANTSVHYDKYAIRITVSIGVASLKTGSETVEELFKQADLALYSEKTSRDSNTG